MWLIVPGQGGCDWISPVSVLESLAHWLNLSYVSKQMNNESLVLFFPSVQMCAMSHQIPVNSVQGQFRAKPWPFLGLNSRNDIMVAYCINLLSRPHNLGNKKISKTDGFFSIKHRLTQAATRLHQLIDGYKWRQSEGLYLYWPHILPAVLMERDWNHLRYADLRRVHLQGAWFLKRG